MPTSLRARLRTPPPPPARRPRIVLLHLGFRVAQRNNKKVRDRVRRESPLTNRYTGRAV